MFTKKQFSFVLFAFLFGFVGQAKWAFAGESADETATTLIEALIQVESGGDDGEIGDEELVKKAYGCLQIRQPCVDDVNKAYGTNYRAEDCLNNRELSLWIYKRYIELYATEKRLGREPTDEDRARIWNGGPNGYRRKSTIKYWKKVQVELKS